MTIAPPITTLAYTTGAVRAARRRRFSPVTDVSMICRAAVRRFVDRRRLTAQEQNNLADAYAGCRPAVFTASLGGHSFATGWW